jgi:holo-[acyl-carrier protein] synthase
LKKRISLLIKGVGIDLIRISRIARAYRRRPERFLKRIFTPREIEFLQQKGNLFPSMAARFAAKEAIAKALGCGIGVIKWCELEVLPGTRGKPVVFLKGGARSWAERCGIKGVEVSMSHDGPYAIAKAVAYGDGTAEKVPF